MKKVFSYLMLPVFCSCAFVARAQDMAGGNPLSAAAKTLYTMTKTNS